MQLPENDKQPRALGYGFQKAADHTPHQLFVEMDELEGEEWVEKARWIKYEEDLEAEAGRWGQPHVSSLSFRSLLNVRWVASRSSWVKTIIYVKKVRSILIHRSHYLIVTT